MKRQLGAVLALVVLSCAPVVWAQSGSSDSDSSSSSSSSSSTSSSSSSSDSSMGAYGTTTPNGGTTGTGTSNPGGYTDPYFQNGAPAPVNGSSGSSQDSSDDQSTTVGPQATFNHPEQLPPLQMINDVTKNSGIALGLNVGSLSDYVWGGKTAPNYWQNMMMWAGTFGFSQIRPNSLIQLGYTGGVNLTNMTFGYYNNFTTLNQQANATILWNFANHWQMRIKDNYLYSDDPFAPFLTYVSNPTPNQPNPTVYSPNAVVEQNLGTIDVANRLTAHDAITFTAAESLQNFIRGTNGLWNSYTYSAGGFYQHMFSEKFAAGGGYNFTALDFGHGQSRSGIQMFEAFMTYKFNPALSISAWVGPELTSSKNIVPIYCTPYGCFVEEKHSTQWDVAEGGTMGYLHNGNSVRMSFSHRITDGGGVLGAVDMYQATIAYARPLSRLWGFSSALMFSNSDSISVYRHQYWNAGQGMINFTRKIGESWTGSAYFLAIHQTQNFYGTPGTSATAGVGLSLRYLWGHSLGR